MEADRVGPAWFLGLVIAGATLLCPDAVWSQDQVGADPAIILGSRIRCRASGVVESRVEGTVLEVGGEYLLLGSDGRQPFRLPWRAITQLEISTGRTGNFKKGALIGGAVGAVSTAASLAQWCHPEALGCPPKAFAFGYVASGVFWGGVIGHLIKSEAWKPVALEHVRVSPTATTGGGVSLALSVAW